MKVSMTHDRGTHTLKVQGESTVIIHVSSFTAFSGSTLYRVNFTVTDCYGRVYIIDRKLHPNNLTVQYARNLTREMGEKSSNAFDEMHTDIAMCFFKTIFYHFAI